MVTQIFVVFCYNFRVFRQIPLHLLAAIVIDMLLEGTFHFLHLSLVWIGLGHILSLKIERSGYKLSLWRVS
jgi:hypothetical protein